MGNGGGGHHVQTVVTYTGRTRKQLRARNKKAKKEMLRLQRQAEQQQAQLERIQAENAIWKAEQEEAESRNFAIAEQNKFNVYLASLQEMNLKEFIPQCNYGEKHYSVVGLTSSGKSTFINAIFGTSLASGLSQTTLSAKAAFKNPQKKLIIWDVPGINKDFSIFDPKNLGFFASCSKIFVLYRDSPKRCDQVIKVLAQIKPKDLYLVRTQCDRWDSTQSKTLQQERAEDMTLLKSWGVSPNAFLQHSSYKFGFDNDAIIKQITN